MTWNVPKPPAERPVRCQLCDFWSADAPPRDYNGLCSVDPVQVPRTSFSPSCDRGIPRRARRQNTKEAPSCEPNQLLREIQFWRDLERTSDQRRQAQRVDRLEAIRKAAAAFIRDRSCLYDISDAIRILLDALREFREWEENQEA